VIREVDDPGEAAAMLRVLRDAVPEDVFARRLEAARRDGYRVLLAQVSGGAVGALGFRLTSDLFRGRRFYIDDLVVQPERRGQGIETQLLTRAQAMAADLGCDHVRLCSGLNRADAHRFYEAHGLTRSSLQFVSAVAQGG